MTKPKKISVIVNSLQPGGAERAAIRLAQGLILEGFEVTLVTLNNKKDFYIVPSNLKRINIEDPFTKNSQIKYRFSKIPLMNQIEFAILHIAYIRKTIKRDPPDIVIAFEALVGTIFAFALCNSGIPLIVSERVNPDPNIYRHHKIAHYFRPLIYKMGAICSVQTAGFFEFVKKTWGVQSVITPNHIFLEDLNLSPINYKEKFEKQNVISIGRLTEQKDYLTMLQAWQLIEKRFVDANLYIYGNGDVNQIKNWIQSLNLRKVYLNPATVDIRNHIINSTLLVSTSRFEGFPNVVLEAISLGVPVVSTLSTDVLKEMAEKQGVQVTSVGDYNQIARYITKLFTDYDFYTKSSRDALTCAKSYLWEEVRDSWLKLIYDSTLNKGVLIEKIIFAKKI